MKEFKLKDEYIKLGQLLKAVGIVDSGLEAKDVILDGEVFVNGEVDQRRGRKIYAGDMVQVFEEEIKVL